MNYKCKKYDERLGLNDIKYEGQTLASLSPLNYTTSVVFLDDIRLIRNAISQIAMLTEPYMPITSLIHLFKISPF